MAGQVLVVGFQRRAFEPVVLAASDPLRPGFRNCDALAVRGVDALAYIYLDRGVKGVGVLLLRERLDMASPILVGVIGDPDFLGFALRRDPLAFSN